MGRWLVRLGINRRRDLDPDGESNRRPATITARYPGHMIHLDVKKVGRIPDGGGWRAHGRGSTADRAARRAKAKKHGGAKAGYVYLHSVVDGYSRLAYTEHLPDETAATTIGFFHRARTFFAAHGIARIVRVVTDNGPNYRAAALARTIDAKNPPTLQSSLSKRPRRRHCQQPRAPTNRSDQCAGTDSNLTLTVTIVHATDRLACRRRHTPADGAAQNRIGRHRSVTMPVLPGSIPGFDGSMPVMAEPSSSR